jgi:hypothetical protein
MESSFKEETLQLLQNKLKKSQEILMLPLEILYLKLKYMQEVEEKEHSAVVLREVSRSLKLHSK